MARSAKPLPPAAPVLNPDQIRWGIERCIAELEAFDLQTVQKRYNIAEVVAIETSIADALGAAFGHGTRRYNNFKGAANLDQGSHVARMGTAFEIFPRFYGMQAAID